jgi:hypothetical protein
MHIARRDAGDDGSDADDNCEPGRGWDVAVAGRGKSDRPMVWVRHREGVAERMSADEPSEAETQSADHPKRSMHLRRSVFTPRVDRSAGAA